MVDPALDHLGRFNAFLDHSIAELKARDMDEPKTVATVLPPVTPMPRPGVNKFALIEQKLAGVNKKMDTRADALLSRIDAFDGKVDATFDKKEAIVAKGEQQMDAFETSFAHIGNEDPNAASTA